MGIVKHFKKFTINYLERVADENMTGVFQSDTPVLASSLILFIMSCLYLILSLRFHSKSRAIAKLPKNLSVNVFDRTFNVFDPYPDRRKIIHSLIALFPLFVMFGSMIFAFTVMVKIFEMGFILSVIVSIVCVDLMMLDEAFEIHKNTDIFIKAVKNGAPLGKGDLTVLFLVKKTLPRLGTYYLSLAIILFASSVTLPYFLPAVLLAFAQFVGLMFGFVSSMEFLAPFLTILLFAIVVVLGQVAAEKVKIKVAGFPSSERTLTSLDLEGMKDLLSLGHGVIVPEPEEMGEDK